MGKTTRSSTAMWAKTIAFSGFTGAFQIWNGGKESLGTATMSAGAGGSTVNDQISSGNEFCP
jgi:hypothetical protein